MSRKVFQIIKNLNLDTATAQLVMQCSPLLMGLKAANLLIINKSAAKEIEELLSETQISYVLLCEEERKLTFLLYREWQLEEYFKLDKVFNMLKNLGYNDKSFKEMLDRFIQRYLNYKKTGINFPHEMGLFLEYPPEDVSGFVINNGKNFLYSGYWKVYKDVPEKIRLFNAYDKSTEFTADLILNGMKIIDMLNNNKIRIGENV